MKFATGKPHRMDDESYYFGLVLAVSSSLFIGSSFIIKKKALLRLSKKGCLRAGSGGFGYLKEWIWWLGLFCMGFGEVTNFAAYAFAPASLVTPLGALSVLVSEVLSSIHLKENLNLIGKVGCLLCLLGSTIIVIHSPSTEDGETVDSLLEKLQHSTFVLYILFVVFLVFVIIFHIGPKYGKRNLIWYIILCSAVGSVTVMSCKSLGIVIREIIQEKSGEHNWLGYLLSVCIALCITLQMVYLNRALDLFNTSIVTPVYYVFFTTFVLIASCVLFKEWRHLSAKDVLGSVCGFTVIIVAVFLLNAFKNFDVTLGDLRGMLRPKRDTLTNDFGSSQSFKSGITRNI